MLEEKNWRCASGPLPQHVIYSGHLCIFMYMTACFNKLYTVRMHFSAYTMKVEVTER